MHKINQIAKLISEDIKTNNGLIFEEDTSDNYVKTLPFDDAKPVQGTVNKDGVYLTRDDEVKAAIDRSPKTIFAFWVDEGVPAVYLSQEHYNQLVQDGEVIVDMGGGYQFEAEMP